MPNPYLAESSESFDEHDFELPIFKPDMVLTHTQLNTLFGYLMLNDAHTRTDLVGVGVVCGLVPQKNRDSIKISRGCGVTTQGDLIRFPDLRIYTHFAPYVLANHVPYAPFQAINGLELWEVFEEPPQSNPSVKFLSEMPMDDKVVMLYLESTHKAADRCSGVDCDNQGDRWQNTLRVFLVKTKDAERLIQKDHLQAAAACYVLPRLRSRRVRIDDRDYDSSLKGFQKLIEIMVEELIEALKKSFDAVSEILKPLYKDTAPVGGWQKELTSKAAKYSKSASIQYVYDWLRDIYDAYEEFRTATCCWLSMCIPREEWFPKHLLLGELNKARCHFTYRHYFLRSPAVLDCKDSREKAKFLHQRIGHLIAHFQVPAEADIRITPSVLGIHPLGERAMPFYYTPEMRLFWNYEKKRKCHTEDLLSYHLPESPPKYVSLPFRYDLGKWEFFRIEGLIGKDIGEVLKTLTVLRSQHNLAFELLGLSIDIRKEGAQIQIIGQVILKNQEPLPGVKITIKGTNRGTATDARGNFRITANVGQVLVVETVGFATKEIVVDSNPNLKIILDDNTPRVATRDLSPFGQFLKQYPGMEHGAGVPVGGTFVIVFQSLNARVRTVVADFYLPYFIQNSQWLKDKIISLENFR